MLALEEKTGVPNPRLRSRPQLRTDCFQYRDGYRVLSASRSFNEVGLQPLRVTEILAYADLMGIPRGRPAQTFLHAMQRMDAVHLGWWADKQNKNKKS